MASFNLNSTTTVQQSLTGNENGLLGQNGAIMVLGADAIVADGNNDIAINGSVMTDVNGIDSFGGVSLELVVGSLGNILVTGSYGVFADVTDSTEVVNNGTISSASNVGIGLFTSDIAASHSLVNTGSISGENTGVYIEARGTTSTIVNSGSIVGASSSGVLGNQSTDAVLEVWNTGTIQGSNYSFYGNSDDGSGTSSDRVYNAGLMQGDIRLFSGDDLYDGRGGTVNGEVRGGEGDDLYIIDDSGTLLVESAGGGIDEVQSEASYALGDNFETLTLLGAGDINGTGNSEANTLTGNAGANILFGGLGDDTLDGGDGNDLLDGGNNNDSLDGGYGDDMLLGRANNDLLLGNNGDDTLNGGTGNDTLRGGNDDDVLAGGRNNDRLFGGNGDDLIVGGAGTDTMYGEADRDVFVFRQADDSPASAAADRIMDFELGIDRIKLSDFGLDASTLSFGGGFVGGGTPSARVFFNGTDTRLLVDDDGDGVTDMHVTVVGVNGLDLGDFIL